MENERQLIEKWLRDSEVKYRSLLNECRRIFSEAEKAREDFKAHERVLEVHTRDTENPFVASEDDGWHFFVSAFFSEDAQNGHKPSIQRKSKPPLEEKPSKTGVIRDIFKKGGDRTWTLDELLEAVPENSPIQLTREDLWRALPRMSSKGELIQSSRGSYRLPRESDEVETEKDLLSEVEPI
jgi:hypothetical protein